MSIFDIVLLALALSVDATVVSFSSGLLFKSKRLKLSLILAFTVGFFQFIMPLIGYFFTKPVTVYVKPYAHFIIFSIFVFLGLKFIKDSFKKSAVAQKSFKKRYVLLIGLATSIDALFAGVSISFCEIGILKPSLIIGVITFINSMLGFWLSEIFSSIKSKYLEIFGGLILIILGFKVLFTGIL